VYGAVTVRLSKLLAGLLDEGAAAGRGAAGRGAVAAAGREAELLPPPPLLLLLVGRMASVRRPMRGAALGAIAPCGF
jgi:hypothetical protein